jgi:mannose/cellobiose epimerase-like protein (N-acyl-D-glucosamine 2-epimerase family)
VGTSYTNYGHNIEAAWLLGDAVDELQAKGVLDASAFLGKAAAMRSVLQEIGEAAIAAGYDTKNGGL